MSAMDEDFWDERYRSADQVWSGHPNATLVSEAAGLTPGRALDIGAGWRQWEEFDARPHAGRGRRRAD